MNDATQMAAQKPIIEIRASVPLVLPRKVYVVLPSILGDVAERQDLRKQLKRAIFDFAICLLLGHEQYHPFVNRKRK